MSDTVSRASDTSVNKTNNCALGDLDHCENKQTTSIKPNIKYIVIPKKSCEIIQCVWRCKYCGKRKESKQESKKWAKKGIEVLGSKYLSLNDKKIQYSTLE